MEYTKMIRMTDEELTSLRQVVLERKQHVDDWLRLAQDRSGLARAKENEHRVKQAVAVLDRVEGLL